MLVFFLCGCLLGLVCFFLTDEPLQLPLLDESFYLLLQVIAFRCVMIVVTVEMTVFVSGPLAKVSF